MLVPKLYEPQVALCHCTLALCRAFDLEAALCKPLAALCREQVVQVVQMLVKSSTHASEAFGETPPAESVGSATATFGETPPVGSGSSGKATKMQCSSEFPRRPLRRSSSRPTRASARGSGHAAPSPCAPIP